MTSERQCCDGLWGYYQTLGRERCTLDSILLAFAIPKDYFPSTEFGFETISEMLVKAGSFCSASMVGVVFTAMLTS